jgi:hypothetical protein
MGRGPSLGVGNLASLQFPPILLIPLIRRGLSVAVRWKPRCKVAARRTSVNYRRPILRSRGVVRAIEIVATLGTAALFSYLILQTRW